MSETGIDNKKPSPAKDGKSSIPVSLESEETQYKILSELIKAEDYYVRKIRSANHSAVHEIMSDSSAIIGAITTFQFGYIKSLLAVSPIVGMLLWERAQAKNDLKRLHRVAELYRKSRDPRYFHILGLELEGIPRSEDLTWEQKKKVEKDIKAILKKPVSFGDSLKNLRDPALEEKIQKAEKSLNRLSLAEIRDIGTRLVTGAKKPAFFLFDTVKDLKNLTTLPVNYAKATVVLLDQTASLAYLPLYDQFNRVAKPVQNWIAARKAAKAAKEEASSAVVARVTKSQTATFTTDPAALSREIKRVKQSLRRAAIESGVNGIAFVCQTAFIINQGVITYNLAAQNEFSAALGVALPSLLALSPLNYFAKNQIDKHNQIKSSRADMARRLDQYAKTLEAVERVKRIVADIYAHKDEKTHLKMAKDLVAMFDNKFNPNWFEEKQLRQKLEVLFKLVAETRKEEEPEIPARELPKPPAETFSSAGPV